MVAETKYGGGRVELLMMDDVFLKPNGGLSNAQQKKIPLFFSFFLFLFTFFSPCFFKSTGARCVGRFAKGRNVWESKKKKKKTGTSA